MFTSRIINVVLTLGVVLLVWDSASSTSTNTTLKQSDPNSDGRIFTTITEEGSSQQIPGLTGAGGLDFNFYNVFTSFVNQTRQTIPDVAYHGNFTLLQLGLLGAIGALAAGAATIVAEGFIFKQYQADLEAYNQMKEGHAAYGPPKSAYGAPTSSYGAPSLTYDAANSLPTDSYHVSHNRKKRDTWQERSEATFSYPQVIRAYENDYQPNDATLQQQRFQNVQFNQQDKFSPAAFHQLEMSNGNHKRPHAMQRQDVLYKNQYISQLMGMSKRRPSGHRLREKQHQIDNDMEYTRGLPVHHSQHHSHKSNQLHNSKHKPKKSTRNHQSKRPKKSNIRQLSAENSTRRVTKAGIHKKHKRKEHQTTTEDYNVTHF